MKATIENFEIENLHFGYGAADVLKGISFAVRSGEIVGVLGPNASGKTTLIKNLAGLLMPRSGHVRLDGRDLAGIPRKDRARLISFVPQDEEIFLPFTVEQVSLMGRAPYLGFWGFESEGDLAKTREAMEATRVWDLRHRRLTDLSGGEHQRVILARALAQEAPLLLMDEPTTHLDIRHQMDLMELCRRLVGEKRLTLVVSLHDLNLASLYCDRIFLLKDGRLFAAGSPQEVITERNLFEVYGTRCTIVRGGGSGLPFYRPERPHP